MGINREPQLFRAESRVDIDLIISLSHASHEMGAGFPIVGMNLQAVI